jgi:WD40 repeat protein
MPTAPFALRHRAIALTHLLFILFALQLPSASGQNLEELTDRLHAAEAAAKYSASLAHHALLLQYASDISLAQMCWQQGQLERAIALLQRHRPAALPDPPLPNDRQGLEWHLLWRLAHPERRVLSHRQLPVGTVAYLADDSGILASEFSYTYAQPGALLSTPLTSAEPTNSLLWQQPENTDATSNNYAGFRSFAIHPSRNMVAVPDRLAIHLLDHSSGEILHTLTGHSDFISAVAFSPDGKVLASGSLDRTIRLWDTDSGALLNTLTDNKLGVLALDFSIDGTLLASGGGDPRAPDWNRRAQGELAIWDLQSQQRHHVIGITASVQSLDYSADGKWLGIGLFNGTVSLMRSNDYLNRREWKHSKSAANCVCFTPDSQSLAIASNDGLIRLRDTKTGDELAIFRGHIGSVDSLAFNRDGSQFISGGADKKIRLWDTNIYSDRVQIQLPAWSIQSLHFNSSHDTLLAADFSNVWLIDTNTCKPRRSLRTGHWTTAMSLSSDDQFLITAGKSEPDGGGAPLVRIWNLDDGTTRTELPTLLDSVRSITSSPQGPFLFGHFTNKDSTSHAIRLWDINTNMTLHDWPDSRVASFSRQGHWLAVATDNRVDLYDLAKQQASHTVEVGATVDAVAFSKDGTKLAVAENNGTVTVWRLDSVQKQTSFVNETASVTHLQFANENSELLIVTPMGVARWNLDRSEKLHSIQTSTTPHVLSPDGRTLITAAGEVQFWQLDTGEPLILYPDYGFSGSKLALSANGKLLAQAGGNRDETNGVILWNATLPSDDPNAAPPTLGTEHQNSSR